LVLWLFRTEKQIRFRRKIFRPFNAWLQTIAPAFEIAELNMIIGEHIAIDEQTGTFSRKYFTARLNEELHRATDREEDLSLVLVQFPIFMI